MRSKGGDVEWLHFQAGSARLLPRLIAGRSRGPQQTLRAAVRRAIDDPPFRALFASDAMILGQWPVRPR